MEIHANLNKSKELNSDFLLEYILINVVVDRKKIIATKKISLDDCVSIANRDGVIAIKNDDNFLKLEFLKKVTIPPNTAEKYVKNILNVPIMPYSRYSFPLKAAYLALVFIRSERKEFMSNPLEIIKSVEKINEKINEKWKTLRINLLSRSGTVVNSLLRFLAKANRQLKGIALKEKKKIAIYIYIIGIGFMGTLNSKINGAIVKRNHAKENNEAGIKGLPVVFLIK